ncbi:hypothetical protein AVEN_101478-1 [Araneus ventricosus]|uniref:Uncharacterized protein n=1 Tax=Araneus ventricosus TaxID=182803 RepID=A0A4Y2X7J9_ARAVE|nr:hypothetical protein AVEN_101478-1 [Araneus ventricosus]
MVKKSWFGKEFSLVQLDQRRVLKLHEGYLETDLIIWNNCHMRRTASEQPSPTPNFRTVRLILGKFKAHRTRVRNGSFVRPDFEPEISEAGLPQGHHGPIRENAICKYL